MTRFGGSNAGGVMFDRRPSLTDLGLPDGHQVLGLAYHEPTRTVVAHVGPPRGGSPRGRLYFRWAADARYQSIMDAPAGSSIDSFALDPVRPSLYFLAYT